MTSSESTVRGGESVQTRQPEANTTCHTEGPCSSSSGYHEDKQGLDCGNRRAQYFVVVPAPPRPPPRRPSHPPPPTPSANNPLGAPAPPRPPPPRPLPPNPPAASHTAHIARPDPSRDRTRYQKEMNTCLIAAQSIPHLTNLILTCHATFNTVNTATALTQLARRRASWEGPQGSLVWTSLTVLVQLVQYWMPAFRVRELVNCVHSLAKLQFAQPELLMAAATFFCHYEQQLTSHDVGNLTWTFSTAEVYDAQLLGVLQRRALAFAPAMRPEELASTVYGLASMRAGSPELFKAFAARALVSCPALKPQELYNIAWGLAEAGLSEPRLFAAMADRAAQQMGNFGAPGLALFLSAYHRAGVQAPVMFEEASVFADTMIWSFRPDELMRVVEAIAASGVCVEGHFFSRAAGALASQAANLTSTQVAQATSVFAGLVSTELWSHPVDHLFSVLAAHAASIVVTFSPGEMAQVAKAYGAAGIGSAELFAAFWSEFLRWQPGALTVLQLFDTLWACSVLKVHMEIPQLPAALVAELERSLEAAAPVTLEPSSLSVAELSGALDAMGLLGPGLSDRLEQLNASSGTDSERSSLENPRNEPPSPDTDTEQVVTEEVGLSRDVDSDREAHHSDHDSCSSSGGSLTPPSTPSHSSVIVVSDEQLRKLESSGASGRMWTTVTVPVHVLDGLAAGSRPSGSRKDSPARACLPQEQTV